MAALGVNVVGANCGRGTDEMLVIAKEMAEARPEGVFLITQSNAGLPQLVGGEFVYTGTPEAMAAFNAVLAKEPRHPQALVNRGNVLRDLKRHDDACASYDAALTLRPDWPPALNNRGLALMDLDRHGLREHASAVLNRYLEKTGDHAGHGKPLALPRFGGQVAG